MSDDRLSVLFVDDEPRILDGLRRQLRAYREQWDVRFAESGEVALRMLEEQPADTVVADMRMPGMTGTQLLQRVLQAHPHTTRIILSGQTDPIGLPRELGCVHQYLQKPCEPEQLCYAIERTHQLSQRLEQPLLRRAVAGITALPPCSEKYQALIAELSKDEPSVCAVGNIVAQDPALTVKLMQLINSAFFGMPRKTSSPHDAVMLLGLKTVFAIVVAGHLFDFIFKTGVNPRDVVKLWAASVELGESACRFAQLDGADKTVQQQSRLAGILSLLGRAILLTQEPEAYALAVEHARTNQCSISDGELWKFGATQDDVTAYALGLWAFADELIEAVAYQREPSRLPSQKRHHPAGYLHLARCQRQIPSFELDGAPGLDEKFIADRNLAYLATGLRRSA